MLEGGSERCADGLRHRLIIRRGATIATTLEVIELPSYPPTMKE